MRASVTTRLQENVKMTDENMFDLLGLFFRLDIEQFMSLWRKKGSLKCRIFDRSFNVNTDFNFEGFKYRPLHLT